ncbi:MAG: hypothetical protein ACI4VN_05995 [Clostridia bacterium]|nr:hypothetical protein [Clostridia bacterium]
MSVDKNRLDNTIKIVADVLEENKDNPQIVEQYKEIVKLKEKRNIN